MTQSDLLAFSTYFVPVDTNSLDPAVWGNTARPVGDFTSERRNMVGTLLWTRTLSPTMLNEARFNVTRWYFDEIASNTEQPWGLPRLWVNQRVGTENPLVSYGPGIGPGVFYQTTYNFRDTLTKVINTHALKIGGDVIFEQNNDKAPWAGTPEYHFSSLWNFANDAPFDEVAFFDPTDGAFTDLASYARTNYYALYVQDDWKARPNLTVTAGLRWDYFSPLQSKNDQISNLILGANGGLVDATLQTGGDLYEKDQNNFGPQIGAAWTPGALGGKAVVRGGFGVSYNRLPGSRLLESRFNPPFFAGFTLTGSNVAYRTASDPTSFDYPNNPAAVLTFDPVTGLPSSGPPVNVNATAQELPNPYIYRYSVDTEYEIGRGWVASVGYQGSQGNNLARPVPYQLFVPPNPRLGNVNMLLTDVDSQFNALLTRLTRRYADGYTFGARVPFRKEHRHVLERSELPADLSVRSVHRRRAVGLRRQAQLQDVRRVGPADLPRSPRPGRHPARRLAAERHRHRRLGLSRGRRCLAAPSARPRSLAAASARCAPSPTRAARSTTPATRSSCSSGASSQAGRSSTSRRRPLDRSPRCRGPASAATASAVRITSRWTRRSPSASACRQSMAWAAASVWSSVPTRSTSSTTST